MSPNERLLALEALRKTRGATTKLVDLRMAKLTDSDRELLLKLFRVPVLRLEQEIQYTWIRYFELVGICGNNPLTILAIE